jgi:hypothetical protein
MREKFIKILSSNYLTSTAMTSRTFSFYYDAVQLAVASFKKIFIRHFSKNFWYSPYPSFAKSSFGMKRSAAELMQ